MADDQTSNVPPRKKIEKPLNPLAAKPGQKYDSTKYQPTKEYEGGKLKDSGDKTEGGIDVVEHAKQK
ncbi:hypothetical protein [Geobacter sp. AOG2]|uniref:hypothetical protein n=1 Tax=Geobacter sp. AOG2 TaxID=1566347 RepID=UPI001CC72E5E|nr:hypothetical protein [Geobacter sp. AOG2]GFE59899.1 hypothetical protein AOG2_04870 [Geobacter sp. AOG2]